MMRSALVVLLVLAACGPRLTAPPKSAPIAEKTTQRIFLDEGGQIRVEEDPFSRRAIRRADYDTHVTKISERVALVVEPQPAVSATISNLLGAALVRRFQGQLAEAEALASPRVFFIKPLISPEATRQTGQMVVDWRLRTASGEDVGAVYAARRLTGEMRGTEPLTAFTVADAEHIALQTAAHLLDTDEIRAAMTDAQVLATIDDTPSPTPRPDSPGVAKRVGGAVETAPKPRSKPKQP